MGGESVYYGCEAGQLLSDNSGLAVFEAHCNVTAVGGPSLPDPTSWPSCGPSALCSDQPEPDAAARASG